jgi:PTS system mannose-specific IIA component
MLGMLVVTHGRLAEDFVQAVQTIVGPVEGLDAVSIGWNDEVDDATRMIEEAIARVDRGQGVIVLTDMFGGTPTNLGLALHERGRIEILTGVNLPMLIKFANLREEISLHDAAARIAEQGREAIHVASHVLDAAQRGPDREPQ